MNLSSFFILASSAHASLPDHWDSPGVIFLKLAAIGFLVLLNGFFVASEFAIVKVRGSQLEALIDEGNKRAKIARHVTAHLDAYLSATQLGITLASLGLGFLGEPFLARIIHPLLHQIGIESPEIARAISITLAFTLLTFLHIVLGELTPKSLAIRRSVDTSLWIGAPLRLFHFLFKPAIWFLNSSANLLLKHVLRLDPVADMDLAHSEEELRMILSNDQGSDVSDLGKELLINALDLKRRVVRDIMTPRGDVIYLDIEDSLEENLEVARTSMHTRFPLCQGHLDNTIGLVHIKDLFVLSTSQKADLIGVKRELLPVHEMMPLEKLLTFFLGKQVHLAIVVDEYGGTVGVVTLDDVLAELVGEIQDEFDIKEERSKKISEDEFVVEGAFGLYELKDLADLDLESSEVSTVGGYVTHLLGHLPKEGETLRIEDFMVTITQADDRRVQELHFKREPLAEEGETGQESTSAKAER